MTKYEELCKLFSSARSDYFKYQDECSNFASVLVNKMISYFGIPHDQITYTPTNKEPEEGKSYTLFGGMHLDEDTYWHIGIIITLSEKPNILPHQPILMVIRLKKEGDMFLVTLKGQNKILEITPEDEKSFIPFYEYIYENIEHLFKDNLQKFLKDSSITKSIGFEIE